MCCLHFSLSSFGFLISVSPLCWRLSTTVSWFITGWSQLRVWTGSFRRARRFVAAGFYRSGVGRDFVRLPNVSLGLFFLGLTSFPQTETPHILAGQSSFWGSRGRWRKGPEGQWVSRLCTLHSLFLAQASLCQLCLVSLGLDALWFKHFRNENLYWVTFN